MRVERQKANGEVEALRGMVTVGGGGEGREEKSMQGVDNSTLVTKRY